MDERVVGLLKEIRNAVNVIATLLAVLLVCLWQSGVIN
jgi:hypothetical protein